MTAGSGSRWSSAGRRASAGRSASSWPGRAVRSPTTPTTPTRPPLLDDRRRRRRHDHRDDRLRHQLQGRRGRPRRPGPQAGRPPRRRRLRRRRPLPRRHPGGDRGAVVAGDAHQHRAVPVARAADGASPTAGPGRLIALTSPFSRRYVEGYAAIGPSKAALESLVVYLAVELAGQGITVNAVSGGLVDTELLRSRVPENGAGRLGPPHTGRPAGRTDRHRLARRLAGRRRFRVDDRPGPDHGRGLLPPMSTDFVAACTAGTAHRPGRAAPAPRSATP